MWINKLVGQAMKAYRQSRFHNAENGRILAKFLSKFLWVMPQKEIIKDIDGIKFQIDLNQIIDSSLFFSGTFEPLTESIIEKFLKPGMVCVDIGANIGYHTFRMAKLTQPNGIVYAIEPSPWAINRLRRNIELNPSLSNITINQVGFSDNHLGNVKTNFQASYSLIGEDEVNQVDEIMITSLDDFVAQKGINKIDFIKMDVDGYEGKILLGSKKTITRDHPIILFEITPSALKKTGIDPVILLNGLRESNYLLYSDRGEPLENLEQFINDHKGNDSSMILAYQGTI